MINERIQACDEELKSIRRVFHQYPELGFQEFKTSKMIADYLEKLGLSVQKGIGGTGVVADINPDHKDIIIALRFDIDGLPVKEETNLEYASKHEGLMHACGHDGHITIGLGTAKILSGIRESVPARIRLIFQPAEEGAGGAKKLVSEGILNDPEIDLIIGLHIMPIIPCGKVGLRNGPIMAMGDRFNIKVYGTGGHGSAPHNTVDPIILSAEIITALQKIISRNIDPCDPAVISLGTINGGNTFNCIPNFVEMSGTVRTVNRKTSEYVQKRMEEIIESVAKGNGGAYTLEYENCFELTYNNEFLVKKLSETVKRCFGEKEAVYLENPLMGSEDFSEYTKNLPGIYFFLGTGNEDGSYHYPIHNSHYSFNEDILTRGVAVLVNYVINLCQSMNKDEFKNKI